MKKHIILIIAVLFAVGMIVSYGVTVRNQNETLSEQAYTIDELQNKIATLTIAIANQKNQLVYDVTGLDTQRLSKDKTVISQFLSLVCTWDSYDDYMTARDTVMRRYGLTEDDSFMTVFMPVVGNITSPDGTKYNQIDTNGLNMRYEDVSQYVTKIRAGEYTYFSIVDICSTWSNGGEAISHAAILYTINADGDIYDITAVPVA